MKKTLAAVAVLGAFAGTALAADVTLYGRIDGGFQYNQESIDLDGKEVVDDSSFKMGSGQSTGSRFGVKGTEEISEGLKVGFVLEHGFNFDDGSASDEDRMWNREASLQLISDTYGTLAIGRMGTIKSDAGTFGFYANVVNPFGTGWSSISAYDVDMFAADSSRWDNMITYKSPTFAGTTVYAQYSMGGNDEEMTHKADRYAALGVNFVAGNLNLAAMVDWTDEAYAKDFLKPGGERDDEYTINVGGNYDFGVAKTFLGVQYFKNANDVAGIVDVGTDAVSAVLDPVKNETEYDAAMKYIGEADAFKGYGITLGADVPAFGGNFLMNVTYTDAEEENWDADVTAYSAGLAYTYPLSKRTNLYAFGAYNNRELEGPSTDKYKVEQDQFQFAFGMVHKF